MEKNLPGVIRPHRYKQLDSLRGIAALTVFFGHFLAIKTDLSLSNNLALSIVGILFNGNAAVIFFFVLSGFVLSLPFIEGEKPLKLTSFYVKRIFRIYPALIFAIIFSLGLKEYVFDKSMMIGFPEWIKSFWALDWNKENIRDIARTFLLIGPNFNTHLIDPPIWSLVIEMKMSLILPFFIIIASRNGLVLNIALLLIIAYLTYKYDNYAMSIFYTGILMAKYKYQLVSKISLWGLITTVAFTILAVGLYNNTLELLSYYHQLKPPYNHIVGDYLAAIGSCMIMLIVIASTKATWFFEHRIFTFFGNISFSFYLIHMPLLLTMTSIFSNKFIFSQAYIFLSTFLLATIISYCMFIFIEQPFQQKATKLLKKYKILNAIGI
ncbi:MAG TPA: acyltransferase [Mucilaginibacter sp.]